MEDTYTSTLLARALAANLTPELGQQLFYGQPIDAFRVGPGERDHVATISKEMVEYFCGTEIINGFIRTDQSGLEFSSLEFPARLCENAGLNVVFQWMGHACMHPEAVQELRGREDSLVLSCSIARALWVLGCGMDAQRMDRWISHNFFAGPLNAAVIQTLWFGLSSECLYHFRARANFWRSLNNAWPGHPLPKQFRTNLGRLMRRIPNLGHYLTTARRTNGRNNNVEAQWNLWFGNAAHLAQGASLVVTQIHQPATTVPEDNGHPQDSIEDAPDISEENLHSDALDYGTTFNPFDNGQAAREAERERIRGLFPNGWAQPYPPGTVGHRRWGSIPNLRAFVREDDLLPDERSDH